MIRNNRSDKFAFIITTATVIAHLGLLIRHPVQAETKLPFSDIEGHWAQACLEELGRREMIGGDFENNTFRPDEPIKRVELAILLSRAFPDVQPIQKAEDFVDIPTNYWAYDAIQDANRKGFLASYIVGVFNPTLEVSRAQVLVALTQGLQYQPRKLSPQQLVQVFEDATQIPEDAKTAIAAATENWLVVNYPNVRQLQPTVSATRAEVATFICQAITGSRETQVIPIQYIARLSINEESNFETQPLQAKSKITKFQTEVLPLSRLEPSPEPSQTAVEMIESSEVEPTPPETLESPSEVTSSDVEMIESSEVEPTPPEMLESPSEVTSSEPELVESLPEFSQSEGSSASKFEARLGEVEAQLFYQRRDEFRFNQELRLQIIRRGKLRFDQAILLISRINPESSDQFVGVTIKDLDGDKEPEIIVDFEAGNTQSSTPSYSIIYRYNPIKRQYTATQQSWEADR